MLLVHEPAGSAFVLARRSAEGRVARTDGRVPVREARRTSRITGFSQSLPASSLSAAATDVASLHPRRNRRFSHRRPWLAPAIHRQPLRSQPTTATTPRASERRTIPGNDPTMSAGPPAIAETPWHAILS